MKENIEKKLKGFQILVLLKKLKIRKGTNSICKLQIIQIQIKPMVYLVAQRNSSKMATISVYRKYESLEIWSNLDF